jgi:hypothetical protein
MKVRRALVSPPRRPREAGDEEGLREGEVGEPEIFTEICAVRFDRFDCRDPDQSFRLSRRTTISTDLANS